MSELANETSYLLDSYVVRAAVTLCDFADS